MHRDGMQNSHDFTFCRLAKQNRCDVGFLVFQDPGFFWKVQAISRGRS